MSQKCFLTDVETVRKRARVRIAQLGGETDFSPDWLLSRSRAGYVEGETLVDMIREDLIAECLAIDSREIVQYLCDRGPTSHRVMNAMLAVEEGHTGRNTRARGRNCSKACRTS